MKAKKIISGLTAFLFTVGLSACGSGDTDITASSETSTTSADTASEVTVAVNTETLLDEEQEALGDVMNQLRDIELENKEIKWLAHWDINPSTDGASKKVELRCKARYTNFTENNS